MYNVIESIELFKKCVEAGLSVLTIDQHSPMEDVYIVDDGGLGLLNIGCSIMAYKLSELLLSMIGKADLGVLF